MKNLLLIPIGIGIVLTLNSCTEDNNTIQTQEYEKRLQLIHPNEDGSKPEDDEEDGSV